MRFRFCVGGRCCEGACDGLCEACSELGRCDATRSDDERCEPITCGAGNLCVEFEQVQRTNRCTGPGACKTTCDGAFAAEGISCEAVAEGINGLCDGAGTCADPRARQGEACESDRNCRDLPCVDGVCCEQACDGDCESCDQSGTCVADALESGCGDGRQCFGRETCLEVLGSACQVDADCGSDNCEPAVGGGTACCEQLCPAGFLCNGDGRCVSPESDLGAACTTGADCIGGRCFDGRCCDVACGGVCERCNAPGQEGRCVAAPTGSGETGCDGNLECAGRGQCRLSLGSGCNFDNDCASSICGPALQGNSEICCEAVCPTGQRCGPAGNCVDAPDPNGAPCSTGLDCISGQCVGGRCCQSACNGVCEACSGLGLCNVNPGNDSRCPVVDCPQGNTICAVYPADITSSLCAGLRTCRTAQTECQPRFAVANTPCEPIAAGVVGRCDGAGNCRDPRDCSGGTFQNGGCQCNDSLLACTDGATTSCRGKVFDFEDGTLQGWEARAGVQSTPGVCGDAFSACLSSFMVASGGLGAHGGQFYASALGAVVAGSARRLSVAVPLCGLGLGATTNLVGRRISAFMQAGSQGGSRAGNTFSLSVADGRATPVVIASTDAATVVGQNTGWRSVSGIVPDNGAARAATFVILALEIPGNDRVVMEFGIDDVQIGD